jgi:hypothetical protein
MASLGQLILILVLAFLVLGAQDLAVKHGSAEAAAGLFITATTPGQGVIISSPTQPLLTEAAQRPPVPPSGPSDQFNGDENSEKPSFGGTDGLRLVKGP